VSGLQEILLIAAILLAIVFIPRMTHRKPSDRTTESGPVAIPGRMRLAMVASLLYAAGLAAYLKPWQEDLLRFVYLGIGPVAIGWLVYWVAAGYGKKKR
jgi:hypothetical protein